MTTETTPPPAIYFYRVNGEHGYLSNLYVRPMTFEGRTFPTAEHAYQYGKPRKPAVREWLMAAPSPHLVAIAAHGLFAYDVVPEWSTIKVPRMREVLRAKFAQHPDLAELLSATAPASLVEASTMDGYWGVGRNGRGQNMLGVLLMELRDSTRP